MFAKIRMEDIQMEVKKAVDAKARWTDRDETEREERGQTREEAQQEERREKEVYSKKEGILRFSKMRVTDLPTNREIILPDERPESVEVGLQAFGAEMLEVARKYINENVDSEGNIKESNLSKTQKAGLHDLKILAKNNNIVTKTDKSDHLSLLTEEEYIETGKPHVKDDEVKTRKET